MVPRFFFCLPLDPIQFDVLKALNEGSQPSEHLRANSTEPARASPSFSQKAGFGQRAQMLEARVTISLALKIGHRAGLLGVDFLYRPARRQ